MPTAFIDRLDNLALVERLGAVRSLTRKARVVFSGPTAGDPRPENYTVLTEALKVCPEPFTAPLNIVGEPEGPPFDALVLVERSPTLAENEPGVVDVILKYEHVLEGPNQELLIGDVAPDPGALTPIIYGKGRCSIVEKSTNFYYPFGDRTQGKRVIVVGHTYKKGDARVAGYPFILPDFPLTVFQGGEVSIPFPQGNFTLMGTVQVSNPWSLAQNFIAKINKDSWLEQPPLTWICSDVQWEMMEVTGPSYRFTFEFQNNSDTWNPTVVFKDQTTGVPPSDILQATDTDADEVLNLVPNPVTGKLQEAGMWNVPAFQTVDFNQLFSAYFEGVPDPNLA